MSQKMETVINQVNNANLQTQVMLQQTTKNSQTDKAYIEMLTKLVYQLIKHKP